MRLNVLYFMPIIALISGCGSSSWKWQATQHYDEFTEDKICRVEKGSQGQRDFSRAFMGQAYGAGITQVFFAENRNGEVRAGVRSEPLIPLAGDVQLKVGGELFTITAKDTPIDLAPQSQISIEGIGSEYSDMMQSIQETVQKIGSPYRAVTDDKAKKLLKAIAETSGEIKFRVIGVNQALSTTGSFTGGSDFSEALKKCHISF